MTDYILETRHLSKRFGRQRGIEDVSLAVRRGTVYGPT